jgi:hypothetical protein
MNSAAANSSLTIKTRADLHRARSVIDADEVIVSARAFKTIGLLPLALKYALFATRAGGRILIEDAHDGDLGTPPFAVAHKTVRTWTFQFIGRDVDLVSLVPKGRIELVRTRPVTPPGWSAGVVFSGRDAEIPTLRRCLAGLVAQPELSPAAGGEIVVCGPARDLSFLSEFPHVSYLNYADVPSERLMISAKKNALIRHLKGPRLAILHARVVLEPGALAAVPREFDITGPNVHVRVGERSVSYLSLTATETVWPGRMPRSSSRFMRHFGDNPLALHERGGLFVDGGAFFVTRSVHAACPLNDLIAWNEGEDVEWCARAFVHGYLVDIAPESCAISQTSKLRIPPALGSATTPLLNLVARARTAKAALRHWAARPGRF